MRHVFRKTLVRATHIRSFEVAPLPNVGWEASKRADEHVIQRRRYSDWHRVERVVSLFRREISELRQQGWIDYPSANHRMTAGDEPA
jgi:hypothetical protein